MYLQEYIRDESGTEFPMVGFLEGKSYPTGSLKRFGYVTLTGGRIFGKEAGGIPAHEFHYYDSEVCGEAFLAGKTNVKPFVEMHDQYRYGTGRISAYSLLWK